MEFDTITTIVMIVVGVLTWLIVILGIARFSKFYISFKRMSKELNNNLNNNTNILKKINSANLEMLFEQRRTSNLTARMLQQFDGAEIIEEFIPATDVQNDELSQE